MRYFVTDVNWHDPVDGSGYYPDLKKDSDPHKLLKFVQYPVAIKIDDIRVTVYSTGDKMWWIGATYYHQKEEFPLMGPYDSVETAVVFLRLHGDVAKLSFD